MKNTNEIYKKHAGTCRGNTQILNGTPNPIYLIFRCECVANFIGTSTAYDCSACEEGGVFNSVQSITAEEGDYDLLSVDGTGRAPTSVLSDGEDSSGGTSSFSQKLKGEHSLNNGNVVYI